MKILVVCQYYYPEPFRVADYCEELVARGHEVTVLTGIPNYPEGKIYSGYDDKKMNGHHEECINGVNVKRCNIIPRKSGVLFRFLNYYSFAISANKRVKDLDDDYDVVLVNQLSPVMMAYPAIKYKKKYNKKMLLYCLDLWPESLCTGGIKKNGTIYKMFHHISRKIYCECNQILVTSREFNKYFVNQFDIDTQRIVYLPQYAEDIFQEDIDIQKPVGEEEIFEFVFAGNIGAAQNVSTIIEAAKQLEKQNVRFHIVGDGSELVNIKELAQQLELESVIFHGRKPLSEMPKFYGMADAMLITLIDDDIMSMTLPGKVQSYMLAEKAIIGAINGETKSVIQEAQCGYCGDPENVEELVAHINQFIGLEYEERKIMGDNSKKYYEENFTRSKFVNKLEEVLLENLN